MEEANEDEVDDPLELGDEVGGDCWERLRPDEFGF
eukprot:CAMPEP_0170482846 /NCGR_PEP_ID=MMETSP0208-20121228/2683_1 /TAXON_ID=197538 /ORGANISM="Strombidium inclinatum, Strain S3" /LENGTH=34 /DNA_ID= /DNA_START= /DNA_END= /DNA_ORIENTATION=